MATAHNRTVCDIKRVLTHFPPEAAEQAEYERMELEAEQRGLVVRCLIVTLNPILALKTLKKTYRLMAKEGPVSRGP